MDGLALAFRQRNLRIHLVAAVGVVAAGFFLGLEQWRWAAVFSAIFLVMMAETFNSAVEAAVDLATQQIHPLARAAKDMAAGAVLLSALYAITVAGVVFVPAAVRALGPAAGALLVGRWPFAVLFLFSSAAVLTLFFQRAPTGRGSDALLENYRSEGKDTAGPAYTKDEHHRSEDHKEHS